MKISVSIIVLFFISLPAFSQGPVTVSGQVKDGQTKDVLEFCNIIYYNMKDSLISGTVTDQKGFYSSDIPMGNYRQVFSYVGNISDTIILYAYENKFQGTIFLERDMNLLDEASVTRSSRSTEIDRDVQVVTKEMKEGSSSAKYVLDKMNGVHYDEFNNTVKVDNDDRVIILVDGIQKDQEYVKNIDPERLKKVEVIRDPSGRYGLEGYSAVINIILDRNYSGIEVLLQGRSLLDTDAIKKEYVPVQNSPSATLTYTYDKFSVYGKLANSYASYNMDNYENKKYENGISVDKVPGLADDVSINVKQQSTDFTFGSDYFVNPKHTVSYEGKIMKFPERSNTVNLYQTINTYFDGNLLSSYDKEIYVGSNSQNTYNSIFYEGRPDEKNTLKSNMAYSNYRNSQAVETIGGPDEYAQNGSDLKRNMNFYAEFDHVFPDNSTMNLGYGYTWENLSSDFTSDWEQNDFETLETRNKLYAYYSRSLAKKLSLKLGAAGEVSARDVGDRTDNYFIFLPHLDLMYSLGAKSSLKFKLRSEANYPTINQTNPFTTFVDFESVQTGNPNLKPEVTNRLSTELNLMQAFTFEPYYHYSKNMIMTTGSLRSDSVFEYRFHNAGFYRNYGINSNITIPFGKSIFLKTSTDFYNSTVEIDDYRNRINDWAMSGQLIYFHQKTKSVAGILYQKNNNKKILAQGYRNQNVDFWMLLLRRPFMNDKLSVMLIYFTPITWGVNPDQVTYLETDTYREKETTSMGFFKNMIMFEITYRFSKGKVLKKEKEVDYIREKENKTIF